MVERAEAGVAADGGYRTWPTGSDEKLTEVVTVRLTLAQYRWLSAMATQANTDRASFLRNLLGSGLSR